MTKPKGSAFSGTLRTIFLDRDGVLNEKMPEGSYVTRWSEFHILPSVPEAIARLNRAGIRVIVVSNQRGIALGLYSAKDVEAIHAGLQEILLAHGARIDRFYFCPHDKQQCTCRKPWPGMFAQAQHDYPDIEVGESAMIGDSFSDIEFGRRLGMRTVFIDGDGKRQKPGAKDAGRLADWRCTSLNDAVEALLAGR